jgi:hypothetical protein
MLILCVAANGSTAKEKQDPDRLDKAKATVEKQIGEWKGAGHSVNVVSDTYVGEIFPDHIFVAVHYPEWPIARKPAEAPGHRLLFVVSKDGKATILSDSKKLEEFFKSTLGTKLNQDKTVRSWLRLRMEFVQDKFYKFNFPEKTEVTGAGSSLTLVTGVVEVVPEAGNKGNFKAVVRFDKNDGFGGITKEEDNVMRGMRPRCQATLLLHEDPLIRAIAEQDLLVLGQYAREYLMEQRAKASEELRREIDRIWAQIVAEGR